MKHAKLYVSGLMIFLGISLFAQKSTTTKSNSDVTKSLNQMSIDEFGVKKDSIKTNFSLPPAEKPSTTTGTKDLNAQEKQKIQSMDVKSKPVANRDSLYWYYKKKWEDSVELAEKNKPVKPEKTTTTPKTTKPANDEDMFISKPVIKGKTEKPKQTPVKETPLKAEEPQLPSKSTKSKVHLDSMMKKPAKDFTFETQPIVSGSKPSYTPDKPKPQPTTLTKANLTLAEEKQRMETYNAYQREADSVRYKNKKWLDSVLAALSVKAPLTVESKDYIEIYVNGGGLISGSDPRLSDRISIFNSGVIQREYNTKQQGDTRYEKKMSRDELVKLAQYIADLGFFEFKASYNCGGDGSCTGRLKQNPQPKPLTITIAIGKERHTVNVDIFAPGDKNWVSYPLGLEKIIYAINSVAEK